MRENKAAVMAFTHREEGSDRPDGGWTTNRNDRGNWTGGQVGVGILAGTKWGIAAHTAKARGIDPLSIKTMTRAQADALYTAKEWPESWGDAWPAGLDLVTYDATVNSGAGRGPKWTCQALGFAGADRKAPIKAYAIDTPGRVAAIKKACAIRMSFLRSLRGPSGWETFGRGWGGRVQRAEAVGVKMQLQYQATGATTGKPTAQVEKQLETEAKAAQKKSNQAGAGGAATGGVSGGATSTVASFDWTAWLFAGSIVLIIIVACAWVWFKHRERARAYMDAARGLIGG